MIVSQEIRNQKFKNGFYGYSQGEVEEFLNRLAVEFENLYADNERLKARIRTLRAQADISQGFETKVNHLQSVAYPVAERIREEAVQGAQALFENTGPHFERLRDSFQEIMHRVEYLNEEAHTLLSIDGPQCSGSPLETITMGETRLTEMADEVALLRIQAQQIIGSMEQWQQSIYADSAHGSTRIMTIESLMSEQWNALEGNVEEKIVMNSAAPEVSSAPGVGESLVLQTDIAQGADLPVADAQVLTDRILHMGSVEAEYDFGGSGAAKGKELIQIGGNLAIGEQTEGAEFASGVRRVGKSDPGRDEGQNAKREADTPSGQAIKIPLSTEEEPWNVGKADHEAVNHFTGMALNVEQTANDPVESIGQGAFSEEKSMLRDLPGIQDGTVNEKKADDSAGGQHEIPGRKGLLRTALLMMVVFLGLAAGMAWKNDLISLPLISGLAAPSAIVDDPTIPKDESAASVPIPVRETTPLLDAVKAGDGEEVKALLVAGESARELNQEGEAPLMVAAYKNDLEIMELLLDGGADPNITEQQWGGTPLMYASYMGRLPTVEMLNDSGAELDTKSKEGWTALMCAAYAGRPQTARFLVERGADPYVVNPDGWNAYDLALLAGRSITASAMVQAGVEPSGQNMDHLTENSLEKNLLIMFSDKFNQWR